MFLFLAALAQPRRSVEVGEPTESVGFGRDHMGYVYILKNSKGNFYIGSTPDLSRRIKQHLSGHTHSTHRMQDLNLVF
ncbi:MAG: GIY-YIG nuclease family protein [Candidatus Zambryskibacteria bacterium]|nr:GIY-YIG nuclease family protein [Candidatus Zambryskibacteria bacterium]